MSFESYNFHECIGRGNFGDVYKATNKSNGKLVAIKVINLDESDEEVGVLLQEIQFLCKLRSPYITKYYETFVNDMSMSIVMEYCGGGSCAELLKCYKKLSEDVTSYIIRDVLRGLAYLHEEHKVHRDIKSANILLTQNGEVKLADFGVSGEITLTGVKRSTFVGTPFWMAPEVIARQKSGYNEKADIWSTGITTIELVTGSPPLAQYDPMKILFEIPKKRPPQLTGIDFSENIKDFVKYCLIKDPKKRPCSSVLLHHRFLRNPKRNINLIRLIEEKNDWMQKHNKHIKKPKYPIDLDQNLPQRNKTNIKWEFTTRRSFSTKNSPMEQTLLIDSSKLSQPYSDVDSPNSPLKSVLSQGPLSTSTPTSPCSPLKPLQSLNHIQYDEPQIPSLEHESKKAPFRYLEDVVIYALQRLQLRAKVSSTKVTIDKLIKIFIEYESAQPGLCEAFIEEMLMLHVTNFNSKNNLDN